MICEKDKRMSRDRFLANKQTGDLGGNHRLHCGKKESYTIIFSRSKQVEKEQEAFQNKMHQAKETNVCGNCHYIE